MTRITTMGIGLLALACMGWTAEDGQAEAVPIVWGEVANGLQLGISPPVGTNGAAVPMFDGSALRARVFCRNAGGSPVRLLASVHTCLLGQGGENAVLVSEMILTPKNGGVPLTVTYQGWNHLTLLDKRRAKDEQPQTTLNRSFGGTTDIELSPEDAKRMTTVLAPGEAGTVEQIHFTPGQRPNCGPVRPEAGRQTDQLPRRGECFPCGGGGCGYRTGDGVGGGDKAGGIERVHPWRVDCMREVDQWVVAVRPQ